MLGTLYVVATPIGNLEDITLRAMRVLREVDLIAAEDTRRTAKLLTHLGIATRTLSFHEHNARARLSQVLDRLRTGDSVAIVTDAGTPGVSDPGIELVRACVDEGIPVDPVPGASAALTAAVASGFPLVPMSIFGFPPPKAKARIDWLHELGDLPHTCTFFESPHRILATLTDAVTVLGERQIVVGRELTKLHQQFLRGNPAGVLADIGEPRGEYTVVVGPSEQAEAPVAASDEEVLAEFWRTTELGLSSRRAEIAAVARRCGRSVRDVYALVERDRRSVE